MLEVDATVLESLVAVVGVVLPELPAVVDITEGSVVSESITSESGSVVSLSIVVVVTVVADALVVDGRGEIVVEL